MEGGEVGEGEELRRRVEKGRGEREGRGKEEVEYIPNSKCITQYTLLKTSYTISLIPYEQPNTHNT